MFLSSSFSVNISEERVWKEQMEHVWHCDDRSCECEQLCKMELGFQTHSWTTNMFPGFSLQLHREGNSMYIFHNLLSDFYIISSWNIVFWQKCYLLTAYVIWKDYWRFQWYFFLGKWETSHVKHSDGDPRAQGETDSWFWGLRVKCKRSLAGFP